MGFRTVKMQPVTYNANSIFPIPVNQMGNLCELVFNLTGTLTLSSAAANTRAAAKRGDEWGLIQKAELIANGQDVLFTFTGPQLVESARRDYGIHPKNCRLLGDTFSTSAPFDSVLPFSVWTPQAKRAIDTALQTDRLNSLRLQVTWGDFTSISSAGSAFSVAPSLAVYGLYNTDPWTPGYLKKTFRNSLSPAGAATNAQMQLPIGPAYHRFLINVTDTSGNDDSTKLNNVRLVSGSTVFADVNKTVLREIARFRSETPRDFSEYTIPIYTAMGTADGTLQDVTATPTEAAIENNFAEVMKAIEQIVRVHRSSVSDARAWYDLNLAVDGSLEQALETVIDGRGLSELYLEFDVSAACNIDVFSQTISPNPFAGQSK